MRYDHGWRPYSPRRGYDASLERGYDGFARARESWPRGRPEPAPRPFAYEQPPGDGHLDTPAYGPARYGLGPYHERLRRRGREDEELKKEVEEALFFDTWVNADAIEVDVQEGVVTLRGVLPSYEEVRYAADDAWDVAGVLGVRCELRVDEG